MTPREIKAEIEYAAPMLVSADVLSHCSICGDCGRANLSPRELRWHAFFGARGLGMYANSRLSVHAFCSHCLDSFERRSWLYWLASSLLQLLMIVLIVGTLVAAAGWLDPHLLGRGSQQDRLILFFSPSIGMAIVGFVLRLIRPLSVPPAQRSLTRQGWVCVKISACSVGGDDEYLPKGFDVILKPEESTNPK